MKNYQGVTFIELVVVIAMIGIMASVVVVSMSSSRNQAKLKAAQTEVASTIKLAQSYALQGRQFSGATPKYYGVVFVSSGPASTKNYSLCSGNDDSCNGIVENSELKDGAVFDPPLTVDERIIFDVPNGNCVLGCNSVINFGLSGSTDTKMITISSSGAVDISN